MKNHFKHLPNKYKQKPNFVENNHVMAILYFEAQAKYDKLIELQKKVEELKKQLTSLDITITPKADISKLQSKLAEARKEMQSLVASAAIAGQQMKMAVENFNSLPKNIKTSATSAKELANSLGEANESISGIGSGISSFTKRFTLAALTLKGIEETINFIKGGVSKIVDFEQANASLAAILGLNVEQLKDMTESAEKLGRTTVYTASQVTQLQTSLSKLGFTKQDILGMQESILYFAQATGSALDDAASATGAALRMFGINSEDYQKEVGRFTGAMAAATMRSALDFRSIADNLATFGPMAHSMNLQIEDTLALFGTLKNMGIEASTAMTSLRNIFTKVAQGKIDGMQNVKSLEDFVAALKEMNNLDPGKGMKMIGPRGGTQFITLIQQADQILELRDKIREGANAETTASMGETMVNSVAGSIKMLQSAWEGFVLSFQKSSVPLKGVLDMVTTGIQKATGFITSGKGDLPLEQINNMVNAIQSVVVALVAYHGMQAMVRAGYKQEATELRALVVAKGEELDADLKVAVGRKMLTVEQAKTIQGLRNQAMAEQEAVRATLAKTEADIKSLTAIREKNIATLQKTEAEIADTKAIMANCTETNRQTYAKSLHRAELKKEALEQAINNSAVKLGTLEAQRNTIAESLNASAKVLNADGTRAATTAQLLWNSAVSKGKKVLDMLTMGLLSNPYALMAIAVGALAYAIYDLVTAEDSATIAQNNLNSAMKAHSDQLDSNKSKAEQLRNVMKDQTATTYQQLKAYRELIATYRNFAGLSKEQIANMSDQEFQSRINAENDQKQKEFLENRVKALRELQTTVNSLSVKQFPAFSNLSDTLFGTEIGLDKKFKELEKKFNVDLSNLFDGTSIIGANYGAVVQEALKASYKEVAQFNNDMRESYTQSVSFTKEEAKELAGFYAKAKSLQDSLSVTEPIIDLAPQMDDIIGRLQAKIAEMRGEVKKHPNLELSLKIGNYEKVLADMLVYKSMLQSQMDKNPLNFKMNFKLPEKFPMFNYPQNYFVQNPSLDNAPVEENKETPQGGNVDKKLRQQQEKYRSTMARINKEREKQAKDAAIAEEEARISALKDGSEKTIAQIKLNYKKEKKKIEENYDKIKETYLQQEKDLWLANPKNADRNEGDWLKSSAYQKANKKFAYTQKQQDARTNQEIAATAKYLNDLISLSNSFDSSQQKALNERRKLTEQIATIESILQKAQKGEITLTQEQNKLLQDRLNIMKQTQSTPIKDEYANKYIMEFGSYEQRLEEIVNGYKEKIAKATAEGDASQAAYYTAKKNNAASELADKQLKDLLADPNYANAMSDALFSPEAMNDIKDKMDRMMSTAAKTMDTDSFAKYLDAYDKVFSRMAEENPYEAFKKSKKDLDAAKKDLEEYKRVYDDTISKEKDVQRGLNVTKGGLEKQLESANTDEEKVAINKKLSAVNIELAQSYQRVESAANNYKNAQAKVDRQTRNTNTSTAKLTDKLGSFRDMFQSLGDVVGGEVGNVMTQTGNLLGTAMTSINTLKTASDTAQTGISKVAAAVEKAVAILAIIQAAWQLINAIVSLFSGGAEKRYQEKISSLEGEIDALDYRFKNLKETMDDTWGLEAINAYSDAVNTLANNIDTQKELINTKLAKSSSALFGGYHSLRAKINSAMKKADWAQINSFLKGAGYDVNIQEIQDLLDLSPEALKALMNSSVWTKIAGIIASQSNKAYSGSEFLNDLQAIADKAQDATDLWEEMAAKMNGISFDSLKEEFKSLVQEADTSFNDIRKSWDNFMREAIYNQIATQYEKDLEDFYKRLADLNEKKNKGQIDDAQYKAALAKLQEEYNQSIQDARNRYEQGLTDAGVNRKDVEQSATQGGFEAMSEETGSKLDGRFASLQATASAILDKMSLASFDKMGVSIDMLNINVGNMNNLAEDIQTIIASSYLELQGIRENTEVIIKPIKEMANNVQELKDKLI